MKRHSQDDRPTQDEVRQAAVAYCAENPIRPPMTTPAGRQAVAGPSALTDSELLEVILEPSRPLTTSKRPQDIEASLQRLGGLNKLSWASSSDLHVEFGDSAANRLQASLELATRIARGKFKDRPIFNRPGLVVDYLRLRYAEIDQEILGVLYLNCRGIVIHERELFRGTLTRIAVEPRAILKEGLLSSAASFLVFHTHPSGSPDPSLEDLEFTRKLTKAGKLLGIALDDHLILGAGDRWVSLKRRGAW